MFITIEGIDGSGKTTQAKMLYDYFVSLGNHVFLTREPGGGGHIGKLISDILRSTNETDAMSELLLIYAARRQHVKMDILPAMESGQIVICDRYFDSSIAYYVARSNDHSFQESLESIKYLHRIAAYDLMPSVTILIDIDPLLANERMRSRGILDKYDTWPKDIVDTVRNTFLKLVDIYSTRMRIVDGHINQNLLHKKILNIVERI